jgi:hypothetical protein
MQKMMKKMSKGGLGKMMRGLPGGGLPPGLGWGRTAFNSATYGKPRIARLNAVRPQFFTPVLLHFRCRISKMRALLGQG